MNDFCQEEDQKSAMRKMDQPILSQMGSFDHMVLDCIKNLRISAQSL